MMAKQNEYQQRPTSRPSQEHKSNPYQQYSFPPTAVDAKRLSSSVPQQNMGYPAYLQQNCPPISEHHRGYNAAHHIPQQSHPDRSRAPPMYPQKSTPTPVEYDSKKIQESKARVNAPQFASPQNPQNLQSVQNMQNMQHMQHMQQMQQTNVPPSQLKNRPPMPAPARAKRESPLDLSVKTVRQSADSTAKDDAEVYMHNFRNFMQGSNTTPVDAR